MDIFAIYDGDRCAGASIMTKYRKFGKADNCEDGRGGARSNAVYQIVNSIEPEPPKRM